MSQRRALHAPSAVFPRGVAIFLSHCDVRYTKTVSDFYQARARSLSLSFSPLFFLLPRPLFLAQLSNLSFDKTQKNN